MEIISFKTKKIILSFLKSVSILKYEAENFLKEIICSNNMAMEVLFTDDNYRRGMLPSLYSTKKLSCDQPCQMIISGN